MVDGLVVPSSGPTLSVNKGLDRAGMSFKIHHNPQPFNVNHRRVNTIIGTDTTNVPPWARSPAVASPRNDPKPLLKSPNMLDDKQRRHLSVTVVGQSLTCANNSSAWFPASVARTRPGATWPVDSRHNPPALLFGIGPS